jgi:hypothetical protein
METIKQLEKLHEALGTWEEVAKELQITYQWINKIRNGENPGKFLQKIIADTVNLKGL